MPAMIALLCVAQFVVVLDATIVAIALPAIQRSLDVAPADLQWVVSAYTLAFAGFLVLAGRLADLRGRRTVFMAGLALFAGASLACGLSRSAGVLVAARAVQGLGAAAVAPAALATITAVVPDGPRRRQALGVWTAAAAGGGASGWLLGGVITEQAGWPWVFLVNVPIAVAAFALAPLVVPETRDGARGRSLDTAGAATLTGGLALLVLGLTRAQIDGAGSPLAAGGTVAGVALLALFIRIEARAADPLLPAALLRADGLAGANLAAAAITASTTPPLLLCVLALQGAHGHSALATGVAVRPVQRRRHRRVVARRAGRARDRHAGCDDGRPRGHRGGRSVDARVRGPGRGAGGAARGVCRHGLQPGVRVRGVDDGRDGGSRSSTRRGGIGVAEHGCAGGNRAGSRGAHKRRGDGRKQGRLRGRDRGRPGGRRGGLARASAVELLDHALARRLVVAPALDLRAVADAAAQMWSKVTSTTSSGRSMTHSSSRPVRPARGLAAAALAGLVRRELSTSSRFSLAVKPLEWPTSRSRPSSS